MFDYVRPGIAIYGGLDITGLKPVMSLWGEKIKTIKILNTSFYLLNNYGRYEHLLQH